MTSKEAQTLLKRYEDGQCSPQEVEALDSWFDKLVEKGEWNWEGRGKHVYYQNILSGINEEIKPKSKKIQPWLRIVASLFVVFTIGLSVFVYLNNSKIGTRSELLANDIAPGKNSAVLTLADGRKITLTDAENGELAQEEDISISKTKDGQLVYRIKEQESAAESQTKINSITTPVGGQYQIELPDGSKVWLNAASSISFPLSFKSMKNREVELIGEAYFEVSKDHKRPFLVKTEHQKVKVLGTHFNISSYKNEKTVKTTLLEGSVAVETSSEKGDQVEVLKPGQQSILEGTKMEIRNVDVEGAVDWKNGYFHFDNENLESIMLKLSRWYSIDVVYMDAEVKSETFQGVVSRYQNVSKVLAILQRTDVVKFSVEGRIISIRKK